MLLKQFKLPLILAAIGLMLFSLNAFMGTAKVSGVNEQKVEQYEAGIEQVHKAEQSRTEQASGDAINVAEKLRRDNAIKKTFAEYRARLSNGDSQGKQPEEVAEHESQHSNNKAVASRCELNADDFSVLITAYNSTFGDQLATDTRSQPAPASAQRKATSRWQPAGTANIQPGIDGVHSANAEQLQQPGKRGARETTATG